MKDLERVELQIEEAKKIQKLRDAAIALTKNMHYKLVIEEGYFRDEASRLCLAKMASMSPTQQEKIDKMQYGPGALMEYISETIRRGQDVDNGIHELQETHTELLKEEANVA